MEKDKYIKNLMNNLRLPSSNTVQPVALEAEKPHKVESIESLLEEIKGLKIAGDKKRLIKIDEKNEDVLRVLNTVFSMDITRLVNYLIMRFIEEHPELKNEMKQSLKNLYHELD